MEKGEEGEKGREGERGKREGRQRERESRAKVKRDTKEKGSKDEERGALCRGAEGAESAVGTSRVDEEETEDSNCEGSFARVRRTTLCSERGLPFT